MPHENKILSRSNCNESPELPLKRTQGITSATVFVAFGLQFISGINGPLHPGRHLSRGVGIAAMQLDSIEGATRQRGALQGL